MSACGYCSLGGAMSCRCYEQALAAMPYTKDGIPFYQKSMVATLLLQQETRPMKNVRDYTTDELERLTTLSFMTCRPGEYGIANASGVVMLRGTEYRIVQKNGSISVGGYDKCVRRVTSFTDPTELDPPQAEMAKELERRRKPQPVEGQEYYDPRLVLSTKGNVHRWTRARGWEFNMANSETHRDWTPNQGASQAMWEKGELVPYTPPAKPTISNATHAGRRVRYTFDGGTGMVTDSDTARVLKAHYEMTGVNTISERGTSKTVDADGLELL